MRTGVKVTSAVLVIIAFVAGVLAATSGANWIGAGDRAGRPTRAANGDQSAPPDASVLAFEEAFVSAAEHAKRSVVQIRSEQVRRIPGGPTVNPFDGTPFENFFRMPDQQPREFRSEALGSGVIIREDGYIATNNHVIDGAEELQVVLDDGTFHDAELVGRDPESDLAVIRIETTGLTAIPFGTEGSVRVGQWVLAVGSPLSSDLGNTVTSGIVSAVHRTSQNLSRLNLFARFIQTDAAINPGNSGGPLVNLSGELIGINSAIMSRSGGNQGIGFAIPVDVVRSVTRQLIESGSVERGFLGVNFDAVSPALASAMSVGRGAAQVTAVTPDSPASKAGLQEGDIITAVNGSELRSAEELRTTIGNLAPGDRVELTLVREGSSRTVEVKLARRAEFLADAGGGEEPAPDADEPLKALGLEVQTLDDAAAQRMGLPEGTRGAVITSVDPGSDAYRNAELRQGDVIVEASRQAVATADDFRDALEAVKAGDSFMVKVLRTAQPGQTRSYFTALMKP